MRAIGRPSSGESQRRPADVPSQPWRFARYDPPAPRGRYIVGGLQLVYLVTATFHLASTIDAHTVGENLAYLGFLIVATAVSGDYFERRTRYPTIETLRALGFAAMVAIAGTWFGRPLAKISTVLVTLAGANLLAAWGHAAAAARSRRFGVADQPDTVVGS